MIKLLAIGAGNPVLYSVLGWMRVQAMLTDSQVAAGFGYAEWRGGYDRAIDAPRRVAKSSRYEMGYGRSPSEFEDDGAAKQARRAIRDFDAALLAVSAATGLAPAVARDVLDRACVEDQLPSTWELPRLQKCLDALAKHLQLTRPS
jgi:hypothetical protein